jgi:deoxyribodipyrimidine photo-lyase
MSIDPRPAVCWIRRDLRLADNQALSVSLAHSREVIPVYVLDPTLTARYAGTKRLAFLFAGLHQLDADLRARGSRLVVRRGLPARVLCDLLAESGAQTVFAEEDFSPYARRRDEEVSDRLPLRLVGSPVLRPPGTVLKADGEPYIIFTPFSRKWKSFPPPRPGDILPAPSQLPGPPEIQSVPIPAEPALPVTVPFPPGEAEAMRRLSTFTSGPDAPVYRYAQTRDRMDLKGTSVLSPYLRFGMISARQAVAAAYQAIAAAPGSEARQGAETWLTELVWREFYTAILYHFPQVESASFRANLQSIAWRNEEDAFAAWCDGRTGYPIVDAAMCQLRQTGWMHNRARMIVASFLVKDLLVDWRWGERYFMQHLVDGDPSANNGGWQWTAGTGTDAAPYFRIFNPVLQGKRFDPQGDYVRRWLPELAKVSGRFIHTPWRMDSAAQRASGCLIDQDYPSPLVDHTHARERTLAAYKQARQKHAAQPAPHARKGAADDEP